MSNAGESGDRGAQQDDVAERTCADEEDAQGIA